MQIFSPSNFKTKGSIIYINMAVTIFSNETLYKSKFINNKLSGPSPLFMQSHKIMIKKQDCRPHKF